MSNWARQNKDISKEYSKQQGDNVPFPNTHTLLPGAKSEAWGTAQGWTWVSPHHTDWLRTDAYSLST